MRRIQHECSLIDLGPADTVSLLYAGPYVTSQNDLWCGLLTGATVAVHSLAREGVTHFAEWIEEQSVTWLHLQMALLRHFFAILEPGRRFPRIRVMAPSGRLYGSDIELIRQRVSDDSRHLQPIRLDRSRSRVRARSSPPT